MFKHKFLARIALLGLALMFQACTTVPETGRQQLLLGGPDAGVQEGFTAFERMKRSTPISTDRQADARLQAVGARIERVVTMPGARWEFVLFDDKTPNAFALPGGKVGVNTGILPITKNDAGLATVVSHEIAHVTARHGAERASHGAVTQIGGAILSVALAAGGYSGAAADLAQGAYGAVSQVGVLLPYSRLQELEADRIGLLYMARAGYDPREAIAFWQRFRAYSSGKGGAKLEFLSTHPLDENRIAELQKYLPQALAEYQKAGGRG